MLIYLPLLILAISTSYSFVKELRAKRFQFFGLEASRDSNPRLYLLLGSGNLLQISIGLAGFLIGYFVGFGQAPIWFFMAAVVLLVAGAVATAAKVSQSIRIGVFSFGSNSYSASSSPRYFWSMVALQALTSILLFLASALGAWHELFSHRA